MAQPGSASALGAEGPRFKSGRPDQPYTARVSERRPASMPWDPPAHRTEDTPRVIRDDPVPPGEEAHLEGPACAVAGELVDEDEREPLSGDLVVQADVAV